MSNDGDVLVYHAEDKCSFPFRKKLKTLFKLKSFLLYSELVQLNYILVLHRLTPYDFYTQSNQRELYVLLQDILINNSFH